MQTAGTQAAPTVCLVFEAMTPRAQRKEVFYGQVWLLTLPLSTHHVSARAWRDTPRHRSLCLLTWIQYPVCWTATCNCFWLIISCKSSLWQAKSHRKWGDCAESVYKVLFFVSAADMRWAAPPWVMRRGLIVNYLLMFSRNLESLEMMSKPKHLLANHQWVSLIYFLDSEVNLLHNDNIPGKPPGGHTHTYTHMHVHAFIQPADDSRCFLNGWKAGKLLTSLH